MDGRPKRIKMYTDLNESALVWTGLEVTSNFLKYSVAAIAVWNFLNMDDFEGDRKNLEQVSCLCYNYFSSMCRLHNFRLLRSFVVGMKKTGDMHQTRFIKVVKAHTVMLR